MFDDIFPLVKLISDCIEKEANQHLKQYNLTLSQARILIYLRERMGEKTSQKDIEDYFEVTHPTVIGILKRLESKGLITSEFDSKDKRIKNIYLTENEASIYKAMDDFRKTTEQKLLQGLTEVQIQELKSLLKSVYANIQE
ncbi:Transcriptional regulator SlyA [Sporotomaculum syntrophicum]|uniref:Transcriptional regulator SlyA n=1 Tax=Sporotomaculum syntrophicum TaxID=182264 RepID=A0A9D2WPJ6_9FIRM|nr:MarR family transcriptional regulator [Sporotomaculum syntrophicum]KAF1084998.1 Transcriptional regulator SlyA [Sporotomaculum syntrophicum]